MCEDAFVLSFFLFFPPVNKTYARHRISNYAKSVIMGLPPTRGDWERRRKEEKGVIYVWISIFKRSEREGGEEEIGYKH